MPSKEYREKYPERVKESAKKYRETHKEEIKIKMKKYRETHKEQIKERMRKWREKNAEKAKESEDKYWEKRAIKYLEEQGIDIHEYSIKRAKNYLRNIKSQKEKRMNFLERKWDRKLNNIIENVEGGDLDE